VQFYNTPSSASSAPAIQRKIASRPATEREMILQTFKVVKANCTSQTAVRGHVVFQGRKIRIPNRPLAESEFRNQFVKEELRYGQIESIPASSFVSSHSSTDRSILSLFLSNYILTRNIHFAHVEISILTQ
jgi:hypothetical protein